ncbi:hypothetical protein [uncultured Croceitalea sp.]|uniref:hypothetical protein n=1 Tax=uncultured Croceitalea sp. TaxID=1798908 RepID=UPI0033068BDC
MKKYMLIVLLFVIQSCSSYSQEGSYFEFNDVYSISLEKYFVHLESQYDSIKNSDDTKKDFLLNDLNRLLSNQIYVLNKFPLNLSIESNRKNVTVVSDYMLRNKFNKKDKLRVIEISPIRSEKELYKLNIRVDELFYSEEKSRISHYETIGNTTLQFDMKCDGRLKFIDFGNGTD